MHASRRALAAEVLAATRAHDERQSDRRARFRNVEPETAELLALLVRASRAQRILELGTSNGYSTIWLADAAEVEEIGALIDLERSVSTVLVEIGAGVRPVVRDD
ncbi:MAG TPA: hypothetical protein VN740_02395 [Solirubrobacteraceae bacterium]|nr:hypothetical protein [Solirubrobacteraceae bacterium]